MQSNKNKANYSTCQIPNKKNILFLMDTDIKTIKKSKTYGL